MFKCVTIKDAGRMFRNPKTRIIGKQGFMLFIVDEEGNEFFIMSQ